LGDERGKGDPAAFLLRGFSLSATTARKKNKVFGGKNACAGKGGGGVVFGRGKGGVHFIKAIDKKSGRRPEGGEGESEPSQ